MYFKDSHVEEWHYNHKLIKIGWLDEGKPYVTGKCPEGFLEKLKTLEVAVRTKGWHDCPFCNNAKSTTQFQFHIKGKVYYDVPYMIIHYIEEHNYLPPQEFIDFVMNSKLKEKKEPKYHRRRRHIPNHSRNYK